MVQKCVDKKSTLNLHLSVGKLSTLVTDYSNTRWRRHEIYVFVEVVRRVGVETR